MIRVVVVSVEWMVNLVIQTVTTVTNTRFPYTALYIEFDRWLCDEWSLVIRTTSLMLDFFTLPRIISSSPSTDNKEVMEVVPLC